MDDFDDLGSTLKELDELDIKQYTPRCSLSNSVKSMATTAEPAADSNMSDFDNSDEDLASLLGDEDDDIFAKKIYGNSPLKTATPEKPSSAVQKTKQANLSNSFEKPAETTHKPFEVNTPSKGVYDGGDDILDSFIESNVSKTSTTNLKSPSPKKNKAKQSNFQTEENNFLDDLAINSISPTKSKSNNNPVKKVKSIDKESDILDDLSVSEKISSKVPEGRRGSFFDDFLHKLSPKHEVKKGIAKEILEENIKNNEDNEDDILGAYIPTAPKKTEISSDVITKSPKRRTSLMKQVSFKDISDDFPETDIALPKAPSIPVKESVSKQSLPETKRSENSIIPAQKAEKVDSNKKEDIDWLNFFKDSPKKTPSAMKKKDNEHLEKRDSVAYSKSKHVMKRQSSADWLGLSDSKSLDDDNAMGDFKHDDEMTATNMKAVRPKSANAPVIRPRRQELSKSIGDWKDEDDDFIKNISQPATSDLSQLLKDTDEKLPRKKSISASPFVKESNEIKRNDIFATSKSKDLPKQKLMNSESLSDTIIQDSLETSKDSIPKVPVDVTHSKNFQQSYEETASFHSMQRMLDESIKERNKLLKENENTKALFEEKIKALEEFNKSEKKVLEDSFKTLESSLKKEFEIKIKSLEDQMNLISNEKEMQGKSFEEKLQNILKEHQHEIQRLKNLHNQSINIMKDDHEEALSRLKKLKEQEIEAILSTQVHSKSLQHLSDQLEARATDLESLHNKVEERNQTTLRERKALLDAKERDLKALQNRLQKQLEDSEDERTRLQQLVLRLESRLQKLTMEGEEDHWETQQMKAKLTIQQKYLEEEQKLNQYQLEKEKEKLRISQDSLLHEQKTVLLQLAQERQQLTQEKIDMQSLAKSIKEEEAKLNVRKLKEESSLETQKQFLLEDKNKLHFEKERIKEECFQLERERDALQREKQQLKREKEAIKEFEMNLKRKSAEVEELSITAAREQERGHREYTEALSIKKEQQLKLQQYTQQMQKLMDKEHHILSEKEKLIAEKIEFEQNKNSVLCTKCKLSLESPIQAPSTDLNLPIVFPLPTNINGLSNQVHHSYVDPNLVIWQITAQKDREFLQEELAFLKSLKDANRKKINK